MATATKKAAAKKPAAKKPAKKTAAAEVVEVDLPAEIFDVEVNIPLIHQVVVAQQAAARQGTHSTKTRGQVRGGGRKPYRQKGTGRARQGSVRAPQYAGGGVVHGPQPRSYAQRTPKKMVAAALRCALSDRARDGRIHVVESLVSGDLPSTKTALAALRGVVADRANFLVVLERSDALTWLSLRNAAEVHIVAVDQLNTYDVLDADDIVFTRGAYDAFVGGTASSGGTVATVTTPAQDAADVTVQETNEETSEEAVEEKPVAKKAPAKKAAAKTAAKTAATDEPTDEATEDAKPELPQGAKAPLKSGGAPKGYPVKGNADSGLYHEPEGQWYDQTEAEFYFKSADDAEAAGFTRAGGEKTEDDQ
jgi:large subunit ribosomal protein L4